MDSGREHRQMHFKRQTQGDKLSTNRRLEQPTWMSGSNYCNMSQPKREENEEREIDTTESSASGRGLSDEVVDGETEDVSEDPADPEKV